MHFMPTSRTGNGPNDVVDLDRLLAYLRDVRLIDSASGSLTPIGDGHSNLTYLLRTDRGEWVLRRPPLGSIASSTHDVLREARILSRLDGRARAPRVWHICERLDVIGASFYLMEYVPGVVLVDALPHSWDFELSAPIVASEFVDTLVELHDIDWRLDGFEGIGKPSGYLVRQLSRFDGLWRDGDVSEVPLIGELHRWLVRGLPSDSDSTVVHGDYRLGNVLFNTEEPVRLAAVLDWEMATVGDPLADVGFMTVLWASPPSRFDVNPVTRRSEFPEADDLAHRYALRAARDLRNLRWYQVLALWKLAVIMERNHRRALKGMSDDPLLLSFHGGVEELAQRGWDIATA